MGSPLRAKLTIDEAGGEPDGGWRVVCWNGQMPRVRSVRSADPDNAVFISCLSPTKENP